MGDRDNKLLKEMIRETAEGFGYECVGVDIDSARGAATTVRIFIDVADVAGEPGGVTHEACEKVSRTFGDYLDRAEEEGDKWFDGKYYIEVSSPGIERPLFTPDHYRRFAGKPVAIHTKSRKRIAGVIESVADANDRVTVAVSDGSTIELPFEEIRKAHLVFKFEKGEKKSTGGTGANRSKKPHGKKKK